MCSESHPCACTRYLPIWVQVWLIMSGAICAFDVFFTMFRPHTLTGGEYETITYAWRIYSELDLRYNTTSDIVTCATGRVMIGEIVLNFVAVVLAWLPWQRVAANSVIIAFLTSAFCFWKTVLYMTLFIAPPQGTFDYLIDDWSLQTIVVFWVMDGIWVVVPLAVLVRLWPKLLPSTTTKYYTFANGAKATAIHHDDYDI